MNEKITKIEVYGKDWWRRSYGGHFQICQIWVNDKMVKELDCGMCYGQHYIDVANAWLSENGYINNPQYTSGNRRVLSFYCQDNNIEFINSLVEVKRKKDLYF